MRSDFVAFILTHGRPDRVYTYRSLRRSGYTGPIVFVVDNEDKTVDEYRRLYGAENVVVFDKAKVAESIDEGDNFRDRRAIIYARNVCFQIARDLGFKYFIELDDDYTNFSHRKTADNRYHSGVTVIDLDSIFEAMLRFYDKVPNLLSVAMAQGGDLIGGGGKNWDRPRRKAMNSFICSVDRPFQFFGRVNEDVNTYTNLGSRGGLFLTICDVQLTQRPTQQNAGGMTEMYLDSGTYVKSFYSVMYQPSSVKIGIMMTKNARIHHHIRWSNTVPCILSQKWQRA